MRIIIKNADFSNVSIGKVGIDLSFDYRGEAILPLVVNPPFSGTVPANAGSANNNTVQFWAASSDSTTYSSMANAERYATDFIEVTTGMTIKAKLKNTDTVPIITCYDDSKSILTPPTNYSQWSGSDESTEKTFVIPSGVKYIKFCMQRITTSSVICGIMP